MVSFKGIPFRNQETVPPTTKRTEAAKLQAKHEAEKDGGEKVDGSKSRPSGSSGTGSVLLVEEVAGGLGGSTFFVSVFPVVVVFGEEHLQVLFCFGNLVVLLVWGGSPHLFVAPAID